MYFAGGVENPTPFADKRLTLDQEGKIRKNGLKYGFLK
jgi:hypothetical protein